jgi:hypothetical protein
MRKATDPPDYNSKHGDLEGHALVVYHLIRGHGYDVMLSNSDCSARISCKLVVCRLSRGTGSSRMNILRANAIYPGCRKVM